MSVRARGARVNAETITPSLTISESGDESVIGLAGGAPVIIGGGQMLGIHPPGLINVGTVAESYYHALGMVFMGFGVVIVATSLWSCFRSLGGGWKAKIEADVTLASWGTSAWWLKGSSE